MIYKGEKLIEEIYIGNNKISSIFLKDSSIFTSEPYEPICNDYIQGTPTEYIVSKQNILKDSILGNPIESIIEQQNIIYDTILGNPIELPILNSYTLKDEILGVITETVYKEEG